MLVLLRHFRGVVSINLYKPGQIDVHIPFPQEWNELSRIEVRCVAGHMLAGYANETAARSAIIIDLLRGRLAAAHLPATILDQINLDDLFSAGLQVLDFLYSENTLTRQPLLVLHYRNWIGSRRKLYGPASDFNSITCGEFEDAEIYFLQFMEEPQHEHLAKLAAILWRPKETPYMRFIASQNRYKTYSTKAIMGYMRTMPAAQLYSIFLWYFGCRSTLPKLFPITHKGSKSSNNDVDLMAFTKCIHGGAGPKNGSREDIRRTLLKEYFMEMELEAIKAEEMEALYNQQKH